MDKKLNKTKRLAASYVVMGCFHTLTTGVSYTLGLVANEMGSGLNEKEKAFIKGHATRAHDQAEILRKLAWRLRKS